MIITSTFNGVQGGKAKVSCSIKNKYEESDVITAALFNGILHTMKNTNKAAFYNAMSQFVDENEYSDCVRWFTDGE